MKITALIALALATAASAQHYSDGCSVSGMKLHDGHDFEAKCNKDGKGTRTTTLDLNKCFANDNCNLVREDHGDYDAACEACRMDETRPTWMWCMCLGNDQRLGSTDINLNAYISNRDGRLCCGNICADD